MANKTFVGLLVLTKIPDGDSEKLVALFQRRGKINTDGPEGFKWQSYSGLCEVTTYGKSEKNESPESALKREMTEELGKEAADLIYKSSPIKIYERTEDDNDHVHIWAALCPREIFKKIKLDISTGGIEIITKNQIPEIRHEYFSQTNKKSSDLRVIIAFEVPESVLEKAFETFK